MRRRLREIITLVGGKVIHPVLGLPGGVAKRVTAEQQAVIKETAADAVDFAHFTLDVFRSVVLANPAYVDLIVSDAFTHRTYYMGLVDEKNRPNFYDGQDPRGHARRGGVRQLRGRRLPRLRGRARRALVAT